jgi:hypothetical protein
MCAIAARAARATAGTRRAPASLMTASSMARSVLGTLLTFFALLAFAAGYYGLTGAPGVPLAWLEGTPFVDYVLPGLLLFVVVGGVFTAAALAVLTHAPWARAAATLAGVLVLAWMALPGLAPIAAVLALVVLVLSMRLPRLVEASADAGTP